MSLKQKIIGSVAALALLGGGSQLPLSQDKEASINNFNSKLAEAQAIRSEYKTDGLELTLDPENINKVRAVIGDKEAEVFTPDIEFTRWDETSFKIKHPAKKKTLLEGLLGGADDPVSFQDDKIVYDDGEKTIRYYSLPVSEEHPEGAYEIEYVFQEKPKSNVLTFEIETDGLDFFYQPPLTQEEIDGGYQRPENVIGSYAVYHNGNPVNYVGGKEYKAGKAFHIYRPKIFDNKGEWVWGELNVDTNNNTLSVTVPQNFLDKAEYPVTVDPTFGYTSLGISGWDLNNLFRCTTYTFPSAGLVNSISVAGYKNGGSGNFKGVIVNSSNSKIVEYAISSIGVLNNTYGTMAFIEISFPTKPLLGPGQNYALCAIGNDSSTIIAADAGSGQYSSANSFLSPVDPTLYVNGSYHLFSTYITYESDPGNTTIAVNSTSSSPILSSPGDPFTFSHTTVSGTNTIMVANISLWQSSAGTGNVDGITYNGQSFTKVRHDITGSIRNEVWYLLNPYVGSTTVSVDLSSAAHISTAQAGVVVFNNVDQYRPVEANNGATGWSTAANVSITTVSNNSYMFGGMTKYNSTSAPTESTSQTRAWSLAGSSIGAAAGYKGPYSSASTTSMGWNWASSYDWSESVISLKQYSLPPFATSSIIFRPNTILRREVIIK